MSNSVSCFFAKICYTGFSLKIFNKILKQNKFLPKNMLSPRKKAKAIKIAQIHENDTGSPEVQISILTKRISELTTHLKKNKNDNHSRRGLIQMVADRRAHLKYLEKKDKARYDKIVKLLDL
jgi:SSU ribosomal protein S15P